MRTIIKIEHVEERKTLTGKPYWRTYAIVKDEMGNEEEAVGYGKDFDLGDRVEYFHHFGQNKMRKTVHKG